MSYEWIIESDIIRLQRQLGEVETSADRNRIHDMIERKRDLLPEEHPEKMPDSFMRACH